MPFNGPDLLQLFFGEFDDVQSVMKQTDALLAVEPIMQKRSTVYISSPVSSFLWHNLLMRASYESMDQDFGSSYRRLTDGKSVTIKPLGDGTLNFYATHEICLIDLRGFYFPFASTSDAKNTIVFGPLKGRWQVDELNTLRLRGWTVDYYAASRLLDETSGLKLEGELSLENGRQFLEYSKAIEYNTEDDGLISTSTTLTVKDDTGIVVDLFGLGLVMED
ncbi:uncharacterized protein N7511_001774 [Penicillium nucicola]|uniref:uncharacterized protein n=1 Tax=Penicillium nucicola TaxID=1850975 RepID=UPI002545A52E|nr:uncharacterized protein N7511_001774 [Penicillium nucicola]KAJ5769723.1 hypothetical protein N7511_001774 [Penicillium nucicola]